MFAKGFFLFWALVAAAACRGETFTFMTAAGSPGVGPDLGMTGDGTNNAARFAGPAGLCLDAGNAVYVADGNAIRRMTALGTNWVVTTLAGVIGQHGTSDGTNTDGRFDSPLGIGLDSAGNLYVADTLNNAIRRISPSGTNWIVTTIAGTTGRLNTGALDGTNGSALFNHPYGVAVDQNGTVYVADTYNSTIRTVIPIGTNWVVSTIAGLATDSGTVDGTNSAARFNGPSSLLVEGGTNLYVADFNNHAIRSVTRIGTNWVVKTIAGVAGAAGSADGTNNTARFYQPEGICEDSFGNLYVSDSGNNIIRKLKRIGTNWVVVTIAGMSGAQGASDGTGSAAQFYFPFGLAMDSSGRLFVADSGNQTLRLGRVAIALDLRLAASQLTVSWPLAATNYALEMNSNVFGKGTWLGISSGISLSGDTYSFQTNTAAFRAFFRLHKP